MGREEIEKFKEDLREVDKVLIISSVVLLITIFLIGLRLTGCLEISWLWILSPIWIYGLIGLGYVVFSLIYILIFWKDI